MQPDDAEQPDLVISADFAKAVENQRLRRLRGEDPGVSPFDSGDSATCFEEVILGDCALDAVLSLAESDALPRRFGKYTLVRVVGRGGTGIVYEAHHPRLGRRVALKVLRPGTADHPRAAERFRREARICASIQHDHIVPIYEADEVDGTAFYAMELVNGISLAEWARSDPRPTAQALCEGISGVARALDAMHSAGVVHRDIKPSNIMVRSDGKMVLADFGLSRAADTTSVTRTGDAIGTPLYMSPEQVRGEHGAVGAPADIYGLGATLFSALTGHPPFDSDEPLALARRILTERPPAVRTLAPQCPVAAERIVMKCMEKRPADRYTDAAALAEDLTACALGAPISGRPVSRLRHGARRWGKLLAAVLIATLGGMWWMSSRPAQVTLAGGFPSAVHVAIDGDAPRGTPFTRELPKGEHTLHFTHPLCQSHAESLATTAGGTTTRVWVLLPRSGHEEEYLALVASERGLKPLPTLTDVSVDRAPSNESAIEVLLPRGEVRRADLTRYALFADLIDHDRNGELRFQVVGSPKPLWTMPFRPNRSRVLADVPVEVRNAIQVGDDVQWGWYPGPNSAPDASAHTATFRLVDDGTTVAPRALRDLPAAVRSVFELQDLLRGKLDTAAFWLAYKGARTGPFGRRNESILLDVLTRWTIDGSEIATQVRSRLVNSNAPLINLANN